MWGFLSLGGWGGLVCLLGGSRRPLLPPSGVSFFDAWLLGITCRPRRRRRRMRLLLVVVASPRGSSMRVGRSSAALGRGLFRRVLSWFFLGFSPSVAPIDGAAALIIWTRKRRAGAARFIRIVSESFRSRQLGAAVASTRARTDQPCISRNRCAHAAQEVRTRRGTSDATQQWMRQETRCPSSPSAD